MYFHLLKIWQMIKNSGYAKYMEDAIFIIPTPIMLQKVVTAMDKLEMKDRDTKGDVYENLLANLVQQELMDNLELLDTLSE